MKIMETINKSTSESIVERQNENRAILSAIAHRMEVVKETPEMTWINDSKSSDLESALYSLEEIQSKVIWIMGADQEDFDYSTFRDFYPENVEHIILFGNQEGAWQKEFSDMNLNFDYCPELSEAVRKANELGNKGEVVLLAPATPGFDTYQNFRERGDHFKSLVKDL